MSINKITRMLLSMAVGVMLVGFTSTTQENKTDLKKEAKPATEMKETKKMHKEHKKAMKSKAAMEKKEKKEMKEEKKRE
ncbi:MAG: hypothetical protein HYV29_00790 [Ignavibacteriales bacterium]|nr:hypothetical protein [Ignavibacteriales bacterium]